MRSVSLVNKLEVEFEGNVMQNAIKFGDVDNDGYNELVASNVYGYLAIYKGRQCKPWKCAHDLGLVACILVGDIFNINKNCLLVFSDDGRCQIFQFDAEPLHSSNNSGSATPFSDAWENESVPTVEPTFMQCLPANIKDVLLADIDGDGHLELVCCLTDRIVRTYKWQWEIASAHRTSGQTTPASEDGAADSANICQLPHQPVNNGYLMAINKWELSHQIGNLSTSIDACGSHYLLIAQPGGTYVSLQHNVGVEAGRENTTTDSDHNVLQNHCLGSSQARNKNITTEIVGGIQCRSKHASGGDSKSQGELLALCTADGTISLVDNDKIIWSFQVDHQLFGITKLDITKDGNDEVIVSSGCGTTYIVDSCMNAVRFQFGEEIRTFCAGVFATSLETGNQAAFAYVTYNNQIVTYHNICHINMKMVCLQDEIEKVEPNIPELMSHIQPATATSNDTTEIYKFCLYGLPYVIERKDNSRANYTNNYGI